MNCNSEHDFIPAFDAIDYVSMDEFALRRCQGCGLMETEICENPVFNNDYYPNDYYGDESRYNKVLALILNILIRLRSHILNRPKAGHVLDIGCGQGWFLKYFSSQGWESLGVEVSAQAALHAREILGLKVLIGEKSTTEIDSAKFDLIVLWHVLEHVSDTEFLLSEIHRLLKKDGQLLLGVPNAGSLEARYTKDGWFHLDVPRHLLHYNYASIDQLLNSNDLEIRKVSYFVPEYDVFSFIQSMQNKMGLPMNLLYRMIRRDSLSKMPLPLESKIASLLAIISFPVLFLASIIWLPFAALLKQGSSMTMLVTKKND